MSKFEIPVLALLLALLPSAAFCQTAITDPGAIQICASVKDVELPTGDRPTATEEGALASCTSVDAYFGFDGAVDPIKARKCAYAEIDRGARAPIAGKAILMMVYANGRGVARNFDAALKLACSIGDAPGDAAGRVHQLDRLKKANWAGNNFSICDHSSGRELYEQCAILQERFDKRERDSQFNDLTNSWSGPQVKAFQAFRSEAERFYQVQAGNGVNLESTFEVQEETFLLNGLLTTLQKFERGELPKYSAAELRKAEAEESAAYARTQTGKEARWGTVTRQGVSRCEEEWRRYRDAWISFGKKRYPSVTEQSWKAWLAIERTVMLNRLLQ
jgi:hypothetical protein